MKSTSEPETFHSFLGGDFRQSQCETAAALHRRWAILLMQAKMLQIGKNETLFSLEVLSRSSMAVTQVSLERVQGTFRLRIAKFHERPWGTSNGLNVRSLAESRTIQIFSIRNDTNPLRIGIIYFQVEGSLNIKMFILMLNFTYRKYPKGK